MHCIIGASGLFSIFNGWILSPLKWFGLVGLLVSHSSQILYVDVARLSLATFVVPTPVKTDSRALQACIRFLSKTGDTKPVDRGKRLAWRRQGGAFSENRTQTDSVFSIPGNSGGQMR